MSQEHNQPVVETNNGIPTDVSIRISIDTLLSTPNMMNYINFAEGQEPASEEEVRAYLQKLKENGQEFL